MKLLIILMSLTGKRKLNCTDWSDVTNSNFCKQKIQKRFARNNPFNKLKKFKIISGFYSQSKMQFNEIGIISFYVEQYFKDKYEIGFLFDQKTLSNDGYIFTDQYALIMNINPYQITNYLFNIHEGSYEKIYVNSNSFHKLTAEIQIFLRFAFSMALNYSSDQFKKLVINSIRQNNSFMKYDQDILNHYQNSDNETLKHEFNDIFFNASSYF